MIQKHATHAVIGAIEPGGESASASVQAAGVSAVALVAASVSGGIVLTIF